MKLNIKINYFRFAYLAPKNGDLIRTDGLHCLYSKNNLVKRIVDIKKPMDWT